MLVGSEETEVHFLDLPSWNSHMGVAFPLRIVASVSSALAIVSILLLLIAICASESPFHMSVSRVIDHNTRVSAELPPEVQSVLPLSPNSNVTQISRSSKNLFFLEFPATPASHSKLVFP